MNRWLIKVQSLLFPPVCALCGGEGAVAVACNSGPDAGNKGCLRDLSSTDLCLDCHADMPQITHACRQCALPVDQTTENAICGNCLTDPPAYEHTTSLFLYQPPVDSLIQQLKFNHRLVYARVLGNLLTGTVGKQDALPQALLPVPLHEARLRERGFNQALEIARPVARELGLPLLSRHCQRTRATQSQTEFSAKDRKKNVRGIFAVTQAIHYSHVAIIDDVMTTGQTVNELAKTLREAGVSRVDVWVCARAELK